MERGSIHRINCEKAKKENLEKFLELVFLVPDNGKEAFRRKHFEDRGLQFEAFSRKRKTRLVNYILSLLITELLRGEGRRKNRALSRWKLYKIQMIISRTSGRNFNNSPKLGFAWKQRADVASKEEKKERKGEKKRIDKTARAVATTRNVELKVLANQG